MLSRLPADFITVWRSRATELSCWGNNDAGQASPPAVCPTLSASPPQITQPRSPGQSAAAVRQSSGGKVQQTESCSLGNLLCCFLVTGSMPMSFQWYYNDAPLFGQQAVADIGVSPAWSIRQLQFVVSNSAGSVTSSVVSIFIVSRP